MTTGRPTTPLLLPAAVLALATLSYTAGCAPPPESTPEPPPVEAISLLGSELRRPELDDAFRQEQEGLLAAAREELAADPGDVDALVWVGRRLGYLGRFREAIDVFTRGLEEHPDEPRLYRHRGHRYITVRELEHATADLERAAELVRDRDPVVEPDGLPNALNQPRGNTHTSIYYHLGLAHYLEGRFEDAALAYRQCLRFSDNDDMRVATAYWLVMSLERLGRRDEAAVVLGTITDDMDVIENHEYHALLRMFQGKTTPEELLAEEEGPGFVTLAYGVGNRFYSGGEEERAFEVFRRIVSTGQWPSFGFIAAEAELFHAAARGVAP